MAAMALSLLADGLESLLSDLSSIYVNINEQEKEKEKGKEKEEKEIDEDDMAAAYSKFEVAVPFTKFQIRELWKVLSIDNSLLPLSFGISPSAFFDSYRYVRSDGDGYCGQSASSHLRGSGVPPPPPLLLNDELVPSTVAPYLYLPSSMLWFPPPSSLPLISFASIRRIKSSFSPPTNLRIFFFNRSPVEDVRVEFRGCPSSCFPPSCLPPFRTKRTNSSKLNSSSSFPPLSPFTFYMQS